MLTYKQIINVCYRQKLGCTKEKKDHSIKERTTQKEKKCFSAIGSEKEKYHISLNDYF